MGKGEIGEKEKKKKRKLLKNYLKKGSKSKINTIPKAPSFSLFSFFVTNIFFLFSRVQTRFVII